MNISDVDYYAVYCPDTDRVYYVSTIKIINSGRKSVYTISDDISELELSDL